MEFCGREEKLTSFFGQTRTFFFFFLMVLVFYLVFEARKTLQNVNGCIFRFSSTTRSWDWWELA